MDACPSFEFIKLVSEYAKMPLEITKFDFDKMIPSVLPDGIADGEMQKTEIALRTELLGMPSDKIFTPSSSVFDFTVVAKASEELKAAGWKATR